MSTGRKQRFSKDLTRKKVSTEMTYEEYKTVKESENALGYGNGGETDKWMAGLSEAEKEAVRKYTGSSYSDMNSALREDDYDNLSGYLKKRINNLEAALDKFNLEKPTVFVRGSGTELLNGASTVAEINAMKGQLVVDKGFTSSSATAKGSFDWKPVIYHINTPSGKGIGGYVRGISGYGSFENEFLFNKGSAYVIKRGYEENGQLHCEVDYYGRVK